MKRLCVSILVTTSAMMCLTSCGNSDSKEAVQKAEQLAVEIGNKTFKTDMELQNAVFEVVVLKSEIKKNISPEAAQSFTSAFETKLREVNDSLATIILGPDA